MDIARHITQKNIAGFISEIERNPPVARECIHGLLAAIHLSSVHGFTAGVKYLIESGIDPDEVDGYGSTALHAACTHGRIDVIDLLIGYGADIECETPHGSTPLLTACTYSNAATVNKLLQMGANISARTSNNDTALHVAIARKKIDVIRALLKRGIYIHAENDAGHAPLQHAIICQSSEDIIDILFSHGAKTDYLDADGASLLEMSREVSHDYISTMKVLIRNGCNVEDIKDDVSYATLKPYADYIRLQNSTSKSFNDNGIGL